MKLQVQRGVWVILLLGYSTLCFSQGTMTLSNFRLQSSAVIYESGDKLTSADYEEQDYWFPVTVPSTVLAGLVGNGVYPSPYFGMNNMRIPDMSDSTNRAYNLGQYSHLPNQENPWKDPYWYRSEFRLPESYIGKRTWLHFDGINYRAEVWLNGVQVADSSEMVGMFKQYRFDVSEVVTPDTINHMAVKIFPLDYPGLPSPAQLNVLGPFYPNGGPTGDIGKNVTMLCSVGWDWMPAVRDRAMGIWQPVYFSQSGPVTIDDPHIITKLPDLPDTSRASIDIKLNLVNHTSHPQKGSLQVIVRPQNFEGGQRQITIGQSLEAGESKHITLDSQKFAKLAIRNPMLWWPNGYGKANLYEMEFSYLVEGERIHKQKISFGIRTVSTKLEDVNGWPRRDFYVNGKNIKLAGGAWVPDMMLQRDSLRYVQEMSLIKNANLNTVRIWGGGIAPPDDFYEQADRHGLMIWQDFWITGDTQGEFKGSPDWPLQGDVFIENLQSTIKRVRNHPSLLVWTGGNEGHAREELYLAMRNAIVQLDGTRPFIPSSSGFAELPEGWPGSWPDDGKSGVYSGGPYTWEEPEQYYRLVNDGKDWVWKDEVGMPSQPVYSSLPKIIPNLVPDTTKPYPLNDTWGYHDAASGNGKYETYYQAVEDRFGAPTGYEDYSTKAQLLNADGYRAIFESVGSKLEGTGGVLLWKLNAAFPSVIWQLYDWYLNPNAGYYFTKRAVEPLHVQLNLDDSTTAVVNRRFGDRHNLLVRARLYNSEMKEVWEKSVTMNAPAEQATESFSLAGELQSQKALTFVELVLEGRNGRIVSQNVYWLAPNDDFSEMERLPASAITVKRIVPADNKNSWLMELENQTDRLAFFVQASIITKTGEEMLPAYWSDNFVSLAPGETRMLEVNIRDVERTGEQLYLHLKGMNVEEQTVSIKEF